MNKLVGNVFEMNADELADLVCDNVEGKEDFNSGNIEEACDTTYIISDLKKEFNNPQNLAIFQQWVEESDDYDEIKVTALVVGLQHMKKIPCNIDYLIIRYL